MLILQCLLHIKQRVGCRILEFRGELDPEIRIGCPHSQTAFKAKLKVCCLRCVFLVWFLSTGKLMGLANYALNPIYLKSSYHILPAFFLGLLGFIGNSFFLSIHFQI